MVEPYSRCQQNNPPKSKAIPKIRDKLLESLNTHAWANTDKTFVFILAPSDLKTNFSWKTKTGAHFGSGAVSHFLSGGCGFVVKWP